MLRKYQKFVLFLFLFCLIGAGVFLMSGEENNTPTQTTPDLKLLNSHSHPEAGKEWVVSFETEGMSDLTIVPQNSDSINDLDFVTLTCNGEERTPQILENDEIFYPNWECLPPEASLPAVVLTEAGAKEDNGVGELTHLVNIARSHTLKFQFGDKIAFAYNNPASVTDTFDDESKVSATSSVVITGGQVKLATAGKENGEACSSDDECISGHCVDSVCCDTACDGTCEACTAAKKGSGDDGTCGYIADGTDPDSECATHYRCNGAGVCTAPCGSATGCVVGSLYSSCSSVCVAYGYCGCYHGCLYNCYSCGYACYYKVSYCRCYNWLYD